MNPRRLRESARPRLESCRGLFPRWWARRHHKGVSSWDVSRPQKQKDEDLANSLDRVNVTLIEKWTRDYMTTWFVR